MREREVDFLIVGAGIIGVTAAYELTRAGRRVLLIDREYPGAGASQGNAGHLATEQIFPIADASLLWQVPKLLADPLGPLAIDWRYSHRIAPWLIRFLWNMRPAQVRRTTEGLSQLSGNSLSAWEELLKATGGQHLIRSTESLTVYEQAATGRKLKQDMKQMQAHGVPVEAIGGDAARERIPGLSKSVRGALHFTATGHVADPLTLLEHVWESASSPVSTAQGASFLQADAVNVKVLDQGVRVSTSRGVIQAKQALLACGAHSRRLIREATKVDPPLDTERGYHLMLPHEKARLPMAVASAERRFIMTPLDGGLRLAGTVEFAGLERPENWHRASILRQHANQLLADELNDEDAKPWMGFRPTLPDCLPVIDCLGRRRQLLMAFGHHHLGLTQSALTARILAEMAHGQTPPVDVAPYRLSRFGRPAITNPHKTQE